MGKQNKNMIVKKYYSGGVEDLGEPGKKGVNVKKIRKNKKKILHLKIKETDVKNIIPEPFDPNLLNNSSFIQE